jgi:hypothetical protein
MLGEVTGRHLPGIARAFGLQVAFRVLVAMARSWVTGRPVTFLSVIQGSPR